MATSITSHHVYGQKKVALAGNAEQLEATNRKLFSLLLIAHPDNTGKIFYGGSDVDSSTQRGLVAGESITISHSISFHLEDIFIDSENDNDGVDFIGVLAI